MNRNKKFVILIVTISFVLAIIGVVMDATKDVRQETEESCYARLDGQTKRLADGFYRAAETDEKILTAMSLSIASGGNYSISHLCTIMNSCDRTGTYGSYVELLRPDNTMLDSDGRIRDVSAYLNFDAEVAKGHYISEVTRSTKNQDEWIIRHAVPVIANGKTIYMLYGTIKLSELAANYTADIYDGKAYVYIIDGDTGNMLLDTWHNSFGNILDFADRQCLSDDNFFTAAENMKRDVGGSLVFRTNSTGELQYMHYEPIGLNHWSVGVTIQECYAFASSIKVQNTMEQMATIIGIIVILYVAFVLFVMLQAYRRVKDVGLNDQITGLQNRNAYDAFLSRHQNTEFASVVCAYIDVNGLHELNNTKGHAAGDFMLSQVAKALKKEFDHNTIYRVGGDEFVVITTEISDSLCREKVEMVYKLLTAKGYSIAFGIASLNNVIGFTDVIHIADEQMLINKREFYACNKRKMR